MVMIGAASVRLDLPVAALETAIATGFGAKGERIVEMNLAALRAGRDALAGLPG